MPKVYVTFCLDVSIQTAEDIEGALEAYSGDDDEYALEVVRGEVIDWSEVDVRW